MFEKSSKCTYTKEKNTDDKNLIVCIVYFLMFLKVDHFSFHNGGRTSGRQSHGDTQRVPSWVPGWHNGKHNGITQWEGNNGKMKKSRLWWVNGEKLLV